MSKSVVNTIYYGSQMGYAKSHTTTLVPDLEDLDAKADVSDLDSTRLSLIKMINQNSSELHSEINEIEQSKVDNVRFEKAVKELFSESRLEKEISAIKSTTDLMIKDIVNRCENEKRAIQNEVNEFQKYNPNNTILPRIEKLSQALAELFNRFLELEKTITDYKQLSSELCKANTVFRDNISNANEVVLSIQDVVLSIQKDKESINNLILSCKSEVLDNIDVANKTRCEAKEVINDMKQTIANGQKTIESYYVNLQQEKERINNLFQCSKNEIKDIVDCASGVIREISTKEQQKIESLYLSLQQTAKNELQNYASNLIEQIKKESNKKKNLWERLFGTRR